MSATAGGVEQAAIQQYCKALRTPTIGTQFAAMAEQAQREEHTYTRYLEALLAMEVEERERNTVARRIQAARFPRMKTLEDFDFSRSKVPANRIRGLADGGYLEHAETCRPDRGVWNGQDAPGHRTGFVHPVWPTFDRLIWPTPSC